MNSLRLVLRAAPPRAPRRAARATLAIVAALAGAASLTLAGAVPAEPPPAARGIATLGTTNPGTNEYPNGALYWLDDFANPGDVRDAADLQHVAVDPASGDVFALTADRVLLRYARDEEQATLTVLHHVPVPPDAMLGLELDPLTRHLLVLVGIGDRIQVHTYAPEGPGGPPAALHMSELAAGSIFGALTAIDHVARRFYVVTQTGKVFVADLAAWPAQPLAFHERAFDGFARLCAPLVVDPTAGYLVVVDAQRVNAFRISETVGDVTEIGRSIAAGSTIHGGFHFAGSGSGFVATNDALLRYTLSPTLPPQLANFAPMALRRDVFVQYDAGGASYGLAADGTSLQKFALTSDAVTFLGQTTTGFPIGDALVHPAAGRLYLLDGRDAPAQRLHAFALGEGKALPELVADLDPPTLGMLGIRSLALDVEGGRLFAATVQSPAALHVFSLPRAVRRMRLEASATAIAGFERVAALAFDPARDVLWASLDTVPPRLAVFSTEPVDAVPTLIGIVDLEGEGAAPHRLELAPDGTSLFGVRLVEGSAARFARFDLEGAGPFPVRERSAPMTFAYLPKHLFVDPHRPLAAVVSVRVAAPEGENPCRLVVIEPGAGDAAPVIRSNIAVTSAEPFVHAIYGAWYDPRDQTIVTVNRGETDSPTRVLHRWSVADPDAAAAAGTQVYANFAASGVVLDAPNSVLYSMDDLLETNKWYVAPGEWPVFQGRIGGPPAGGFEPTRATDFLVAYDRTRGILVGTRFAAEFLTTRMESVAVTHEPLIHANRIAVPGNGWIEDVGWHAHGDVGHVMLALYREEGDGDLRLVWESGPREVEGPGSWNVATTAGPLGWAVGVAPGTYWMAWMYDAWYPVPGMVSRDVSPARERYLGAFGAFPEVIPAGERLRAQEEWSMYATFTDDALFDGLAVR